VRSKWSTEEQFPNGNSVRKWRRQKKRFNDHLAEGIQLLNAIQDVYLSPEVTVA
jgi:hypothetical protein